MGLMAGVASVVGGRGQVFVSYAGADRAWAEWAAATLEAAGYAVELDVWDWAAGDNVPLRMSTALARAEVVVALWSPAYFAPDRFTIDEWTPLLVGRPKVRTRLVPVRVAQVTPPVILRSLVFRDVFGLDGDRARAVLVEAVEGPAGHRSGVPYPGQGPGTTEMTVPTMAPAGDGSRVPGSLPSVWNVPARLNGFTGRQPQLARLRALLNGGQRRALVAAVNGLGGIGKTQLGVEYAHLFAADYDLVWWVDAERGDLIGDNLSSLGLAAGWVDPASTVETAWAAVAARLRVTGRWLVVFDNVEHPDHIRPWLPQGPGQVLITSRHRGYTGLAVPVELEVFTRTESLALIAAHLPVLSQAEADALATAVGDLPLALAQAVGLLTETAMTVPEYLDELQAHSSDVLTEGRAGHYPVPVAAAIQASLTRLARQDPAALDLLRLAAVLAPDPIPLVWLPAAATDLPPALAAVVGRALALRRTLGRLADLGLAIVTERTLQVHRLTQAVVRDQRSPDQLAADRDHAVALVVAAGPDNNGTDPASWPAWARLLPHLLALDPTTAAPAIRRTAYNGLWYLLRRGEPYTALPYARAWHAAWREASHPDDYHVLWAANQLAATYRDLGRYKDAYDLDQNVYDTRRRVLGVDHPDTLTSANNLACDLRGLGRNQEAYDLDRAADDDCRRVLGLDHPDTLASVNNLAADLRGLDRYQEAYDLDQVTNDDCRRVLGLDHPDTLTSANNLACDLRGLGRSQDAYDLDRAVYDTRRRVLGPDHPDTLTSARNLVLDLRELGCHAEAEALEQERFPEEE